MPCLVLSPCPAARSARCASARRSSAPRGRASFTVRAAAEEKPPSQPHATWRQRSRPADARERQPAAAAKPKGMSAEQKAKLRAEYTGFGGAENKALPSNYFLIISLVIAGLALLSKAGGLLG